MLLTRIVTPAGVALAASTGSKSSNPAPVGAGTPVFGNVAQAARAARLESRSKRRFTAGE
jgi:hypothetical protein